MQVLKKAIDDPSYCSFTENKIISSMDALLCTSASGLRKGESSSTIENMLEAVSTTLFPLDAEVKNSPLRSIPYSQSQSSPDKDLISVYHDQGALCEFSDNDKIFSLSFPLAFPLGKSLTSKGSVDKRERMHLMNQFTNVFSSNKPLLFLLLNQAQRHAACSAVTTKLKNDFVSFESFSKFQNSDEFKQLVIKAKTNPKGNIFTTTTTTTTTTTIFAYSNIYRS